MRTRIVLVGLLLSTSAVVSAQESTRRGFWWGLGAGPAHLEMDCEGCNELPDSIPYGGGTGFQFSAVAGGALSPRFLLGGSGFLASRFSENRDAAVINVNAVGQFYPRAEGRFFLRGGAGLSFSMLAGGGTLVEVVGLAAHLDVGMDLWRSGRRAIGPYLGVMLAANDRASASIAQPEPLRIGPPRRPRAVYLGASVAWY